MQNNLTSCLSRSTFLFVTTELTREPLREEIRYDAAASILDLRQRFEIRTLACNDAEMSRARSKRTPADEMLRAQSRPTNQTKGVSCATSNMARATKQNMVLRI